MKATLRRYIQFPLPQVGGLFRSGGLLLAAHSIRGVAALATMLLLSWQVPVGDVGLFAFAQNYFLWGALLAECGVAISTCRRLSVASVDDQPRIYTSFLVLFAMVAAGFTVVTLAAAPWIGKISDLPVAPILVTCAIPGIGVLWQAALREILPGLRAVRQIALLEAGPWLLCIAILSASRFGLFHLTASRAVLAFTCSLSLITIVTSFLLHFRFQPNRADVQQTIRVVKSFGLHVYVGRLVGTGGFILDIPLIGVLTHDSKALALYALAKSLAAPLGLIGQSISTSLFRELATSSRVPRYAIVISFTLCLAATLGYAVLGQLAITFLLPPAYHGIGPYLAVWVLCFAVQSQYQLPTAWLRARGHGKSMRSLAIIFGLVAAFGYIVLIPFAGVMGAAIAACLASIFWLVASIVFYRKLRVEQ